MHRKQLNLNTFLVLLLITVLTLGTVTAAFSYFHYLSTESGYNPGFPGAKVGIYGVKPVNWGSDWQGNNLFSAIGSVGSSILYHKGAGDSYDKVYWGASPGPSGVNLIWDTQPLVAVLPSGGISERQLNVEVQRDIPLSAFFNGETLTFANGTAITDPNMGKLIQYWHLSSTVTGTQTHFNLTKQEYLLVPGNFNVSFWMPPSNYNTQTESGWQEGTWHSINFVFALYWHEWLNDLGPVTDPAPPNIPLNASDVNAVGWSLRGGFPIAGWIQRYQMLIQGPNGQYYDLFKWTTSDGNNLGSNYADPNLVSNLKALVDFLPSLPGRPLDLYNDPALAASGASPDTRLQQLNGTAIDGRANAVTPSPEITPTQYFTISLNTFGTYPQSLGFLQGWRIYYPCVTFQLRVIFGVYGSHSYLWTENTAQSNGYPGWQGRTVETTYTAGPLTGLLDWLALNWGWLIFWVIIALVIVMTILNPGLWASLVNLAQGRQARKPIGYNTRRAVERRHVFNQLRAR